MIEMTMAKVDALEHLARTAYPATHGWVAVRGEELLALTALARRALAQCSPEERREPAEPNTEAARPEEWLDTLGELLASAVLSHVREDYSYPGRRLRQLARALLGKDGTEIPRVVRQEASPEERRSYDEQAEWLLQQPNARQEIAWSLKAEHDNGMRLGVSDTGKGGG
jgi:hypothetical protein